MISFTLIAVRKQRTNIKRIKKSNKGLYKTKQNIMTVPYVYWRIKSPFESKRKVLSLFLSFNRRKRKKRCAKKTCSSKKVKISQFFLNANSFCAWPTICCAHQCAHAYRPNTVYVQFKLLTPSVCWSFVKRIICLVHSFTLNHFVRLLLKMVYWENRKINIGIFVLSIFGVYLNVLIV